MTEKENKTLFLTTYEETYQSQNTSIFSPLFSVTRFMAKQFSLISIAKNLIQVMNRVNTIKYHLLYLLIIHLLVFWCCFVLFLRRDLTIYLYLWSMWWPEAMCTSVVCVPTRNHDIFAVHVATEGHADVYILCCRWGTGWFLWFLLRLEAMWMSVVVCAVDGDRVEVHGSCDLWKPCWYSCLVQPGWCSCSMMHPRAVLMPMICAATINHVEVYNLCCCWL